MDYNNKKVHRAAPMLFPDMISDPPYNINIAAVSWGRLGTWKGWASPTWCAGSTYNK